MRKKIYIMTIIFLGIFSLLFYDSSLPAAERQKLFGTVEFRRDIADFGPWNEMLSRKLTDNIFTPQRKLGREKWENILSKAQKMDLNEKLKFVNVFWNAWPYHTDMDNWNMQDYWEAPHEFVTYSGDCEDYAISKYFTLKELGVPVESMRLAVVTDKIRKLQHAILVVYTAEGIRILDNLSKNVLKAEKVRNYIPHYSLNENGLWNHFEGKKK